MFDQKVLPSISNMKTFELFLKSDLKYCVLQNFHISLLSSLCSKVHQYNKKCLVHIDLIKGIGHDEFGAEYLCQEMKVDGLISTHPTVIHATKKKGKIAIQRIFLIDSMSLYKSIELIKKTRPNFIEILPAIAYSVVKRIKNEVDTPIIGGGLINNKNDIINCLKSGIIGVTTSDKSLWYL